MAATTGIFVPDSIAEHFGLSRPPRWLDAKWVPVPRLVDSGVLAELRVEHHRLLEGIVAAHAAFEDVMRREAPADFAARLTWRMDDGPRGMKANEEVREARKAVDRAMLALVEWLRGLREQPDAVQDELTRLMRAVARNDEQRWPEVQAAGRFATQLVDRDMEKAVDRVFRAAGGERDAVTG